MELGDLIDSIDIVEYIGQFVELEERGDEWWGISPFTDPPENTPSFSVRPLTGKFFDFSSGIGGSVFTFVKFYFKCTGREAVEKLKAYAGCESQEFAPKEKMSATLTCEKYARPKTRSKIDKSTVLSDNYMERYEINRDKFQIWVDEGISEDALRKYQVRYDSFADRLVYPIRSVDGKIVNIGARALDPQWKEKGQRKYCYYFQWGVMQTIYGLAENMESILRKREIILFEGCKSVMKADSWGITNTGAILTSHLNPAQMKILARLGCRVVFALDKEVDIRKDHNITKLKDYVNVEYIRDKDGLLDEKDAPVDQGKDVFLSLYEGRIRYR